MKLFFKSLILLLLLHSGVSAKPKNIIIIAGEKSHGEGDHEYLKSAKLLKFWLDNAPNLKNIKTETYFNGWPQDSSKLNTADVIVLLSDGESNHPFVKGTRIKMIQKQMQRGCGLVLLHYSTFTPLQYSQQFLSWTGGFFDYESGNFQKSGPEAWSSAITFQTVKINPFDTTHPISRGVSPFDITDEFYYKIKFKENDLKLKPIIRVNFKGIEDDQTIAWSIQREDGGRGFGYTGGHIYKNWEIPQLRKLILNAIVWTAGMDVPRDGVKSEFVSEETAIKNLYGTPVKGLILTGYNSPEHDWASTSVAIDNALESNPRMMIDVSNNIEDLATKNLVPYSFLILNYNNWDRKGLSENAKNNFIKYLSNGGGLMIIHFANAAFNSSLPAGKDADWPEYRTICRRVWDGQSNSDHDNYSKIKVSIAKSSHPILKGLKPFETPDEIFFNLDGSLPVEALITAYSTKKGGTVPLAWVYSYDQGQVFQTVLGHDSKSLQTAEVQQILKNAAFWIAEKMIPSTKKIKSSLKN